MLKNTRRNREQGKQTQKLPTQRGRNKNLNTLGRKTNEVKLIINKKGWGSTEGRQKGELSMTHGEK